MTFSIPQGFSDDTAVTLNGPEVANGIRHSIVLKRHALDERLEPELYAELQEELMKELFPGARIVKSDSKNINGRDVEIREFSFVTDGEKVRQFQAYFMTDKEALILCASANDDERFGLLRTIALQLLATLRVA